MKKKIAFFSLLFFFSIGLSAQGKLDEMQTREKGISESVSEKSLSQNGVVAVFSRQLSESEINQVLEIDLDSYRMIDERTHLLIQDGPRLELLSFNEMIKNDYEFDTDLYESKLSEIIIPEKYSSVPLLNIDFGKARVSEIE